jgi:hypothetical protein
LIFEQSTREDCDSPGLADTGGFADDRFVDVAGEDVSLRRCRTFWKKAFENSAPLG